MTEPTSCMCPTCQSYCMAKPGFMMPGEADKIAEYLGLSTRELFQRYLVAEHSLDGSMMVLLPAGASQRPGTAVPAVDGPGRCVFLTEAGLCAIHRVKPRGCALVDHSQPPEEKHAIHEHIGNSWREFQEDILNLLKDE